jgi:SpoVK/Ycf46/Vps4 family AAA+-type ATPase
VNIAQTSWSDIGGLEEAKQRLREAVEWPLKHASSFERLGLRPTKGILLHGPAGCSKTTLVKAIANASQGILSLSLSLSNLIVISSPFSSSS